MKNWKIKLVKFTSLICIFGVVFAASPLSVLALKIGDLEIPDNMIIGAGECSSVLANGDPKRNIKGFEAELKDFMTFLDDNFKNKSSTSSLTSLAIARYREYKEALKLQFKSVQLLGSKKAEEDLEGKGINPWDAALMTGDELSVFSDEIRQYALCEEMVNTYISKGREIMLKHIKTSAAQKKTIMLVEKFKALNVRLRGLNMKIAEMFALIATFKTKFPGFAAKSCMKKLF